MKLAVLTSFTMLFMAWAGPPDQTPDPNKPPDQPPDQPGSSSNSAAAALIGSSPQDSAAGPPPEPSEAVIPPSEIERQQAQLDRLHLRLEAEALRSKTQSEALEETFGRHHGRSQPLGADHHTIAPYI